MEEERAYTKRDWRRAVNASAILGWFCVTVPIIYETGIEGIGLLPWIAGVGLPIAFIFCWVIVAPILWRIMRKSVSWLYAVVWGVAISITMAAVSIIISHLNGLRISRGTYADFHLVRGDFTREADRILTLYGWYDLLQNTALFILVCVLIALLIRAIIGSGVKHSSK
jgi:hypothetical protein